MRSIAPYFLLPILIAGLVAALWGLHLSGRFLWNQGIAIIGSVVGIQIDSNKTFMNLLYLCCIWLLSEFLRSIGQFVLKEVNRQRMTLSDVYFGIFSVVVGVGIFIAIVEVPLVWSIPVLLFTMVYLVVYIAFYGRKKHS